MICKANPKRTHNDTVVLWCSRTDPVWSHRRCSGIYTHPCGCQVPCPCPGHRDNHALLADLEDHIVPDYLDAPFQRPGEQETIPTLVSVPELHGGTPGRPAQMPEDDPRGGRSKDDPPDPLAAMTLEQAAEVYAEAGARLLAAFDDDPDQPFHLLRVIRRGITRGREVDALLCRWIIAHESYGEQVVDGIGQVRVRRTQAGVRWDERGTAFAYVDARIQAADGEYPDPHTVVDWLLEAAAVGYYRKTALTGAGLDPGDFYTSTPGNPAVDLPAEGD